MDVYRLSEDISNIIWDLVKQWSFFNKDTIGKQLVKAADSISANLAESHGRFHFRDKQKFTYYARGSLEETKCWLIKIRHRNLITKQEIEQLCVMIDDLGPKLNQLIKSYQSLNNGYR